jgi:hypothetical protein
MVDSMVRVGVIIDEWRPQMMAHTHLVIAIGGFVEELHL